MSNHFNAFNSWHDASKVAPLGGSVGDTPLSEHGGGWSCDCRAAKRRLSKGNVMTIRPMSCLNPSDVERNNSRRTQMENGIRDEVEAFRVEGGNPRLDEAIAVRVLARRITDYLEKKWGLLEPPPGAGFKAAGLFFQLRLKAVNAGDMETVRMLDEMREAICGTEGKGWAR